MTNAQNKEINRQKEKKKWNKQLSTDLTDTSNTPLICSTPFVGTDGTISE